MDRAIPGNNRCGAVSILERGKNMRMTVRKRIGAFVTMALSAGFLSATLAQAQAPTPPEQDALRVTVDANGVIKIDSETIERVKLQARVEELLKDRTNKVAIVAASPALPFATVVTVINAVRNAGASKVGLLAVNPAR